MFEIQIWLNSLHFTDKFHPDALQGFFGITFESQHDDRRRVGCSGQRKAVLPFDAHAVNRDDGFRVRKAAMLLEFLDESLVYKNMSGRRFCPNSL